MMVLRRKIILGLCLSCATLVAHAHFLDRAPKDNPATSGSAVAFMSSTKTPLYQTALQARDHDTSATSVDFVRKTVKGGSQSPNKSRFFVKKEYLAEFIGTTLLMVFGLGANASGTLLNSFQGVWQIASAWGVAVMIAVYCTASVSGAHINPAVSFALATQQKKTGFTWKDFRGYATSQLLGGFTGAAIVYGLFVDFIRKDPAPVGSMKLAQIFACYPNAMLKGTMSAFTIEAAATFLLMFAIKAIGDPHNAALRNKDLAPAFVGAAVALLCALFGPLTQCCMNPARDLGPRLLLAAVGYGRTALPGPGACALAYLVGPALGAAAGAAAYDAALAAAPAVPAAAAPAPAPAPAPAAAAPIQAPPAPAAPTAPAPAAVAEAGPPAAVVEPEPEEPAAAASSENAPYYTMEAVAAGVVMEEERVGGSDEGGEGITAAE